MIPTLGRIVLYKDPQQRNGAMEVPAIITRVWSEDCVNLMVFFDDGTPEQRTSQQLSAGHWRWPDRV